jgi:hypothetical protein
MKSAINGELSPEDAAAVEDALGIAERIIRRRRLLGG